VAYSPDGKRIVSASSGRTLKVWDAQTGRELISLQGPNEAVRDVAFSRDGKRLISVGLGNTLKVWDSEDVSAIDHLALRLVQSLFHRPLLKTEVMEKLRGDNAIREAVRQKALSLADRFKADPDVLNDASWDIVARPGANAAAYARALVLAAEACRLAPSNGLYLNTLGAAQYRVGAYKQALEILTRSEKLNAEKNQGSCPCDLAFLAMTYHQLGQQKQAQETLRRLRETMKNPEWAEDEEAKAFLREAETLVQGQKGSGL